VRIRTDDEVYRVDAVWLGPPKATFPWRARYVAWGVGIVVFLVVLLIERRMGLGFGFFSTGWAIVVTIVLTKVICARITHERPLTAVAVMWLRELTAPRKVAESRGGAASATKIRLRTQRPRPRPKGVRRVRPTG
jgi:Na+/melibiose symporter-like transporter